MGGFLSAPDWLDQNLIDPNAMWQQQQAMENALTSANILRADQSIVYCLGPPEIQQSIDPNTKEITLISHIPEHGHFDSKHTAAGNVEKRVHWGTPYLFHKKIKSHTNGLLVYLKLQSQKANPAKLYIPWSIFKQNFSAVDPQTLAQGGMSPTTEDQWAAANPSMEEEAKKLTQNIKELTRKPSSKHSSPSAYPPPYGGYPPPPYGGYPPPPYYGYPPPPYGRYYY
jgi:hypothetical protein